MRQRTSPRTRAGNQNQGVSGQSKPARGVGGSQAAKLQRNQTLDLPDLHQDNQDQDRREQRRDKGRRLSHSRGNL